MQSAFAPLLFIVALAAPASGSCDLGPWLQAEPGTDEGYHVLCKAADAVDVHVGGAVGAPSRRLAFNQSFPLVLEEVLAQAGKPLAAELVFLPRNQPSGRGRWKGGEVRWRKQSWALFTGDGERLEVGAAIELWKRLREYKGALLLFEGGAWRWPGIRVGFERPVLPGVVLRTVALRPALFELAFVGATGGSAEGGLGPQLLDGVVEWAEPQLRRSLAEGGVVSYRSSEQAWFDYKATKPLARLQALTAELTRLPAEYFEKNLQVLRYKEGQFYDAHRDYWDPREFPDEGRFLHPRSRLWNMRLATVLWFLRPPADGGDTWFPRAHGGPIPWDEWTACDDRGVKMNGRNGTIAILFYNLYSSGEVDDFSWHCGCPVSSGVKWAANSWIWNQPLEGRTAKKRPLRAGVNAAAEAEADSRPEEASEAVTVTFKNRRPGELQVLWVSPAAPPVEVPMFQLAAGAVHSLDSFVGHTFVARESSTAAVAQRYTVPSGRAQRVVEFRDGGNLEL